MKFSELKECEGVDVDLEISLFEYGMVWCKDGDDYKFIYGVAWGCEDYGDCHYNQFDYAHMSLKDFKELLEEDWFEADAVVKFCGLNKAEELVANFPYSVYDVVQYYGYENVFGSSYYPFEIKGV